jgi:hypothetical protein
VFRTRGIWGFRAGLGAATLAVVVAGSGCSPREAGAAAVVGDRRITTDQLSAAVASIKVGNPQIGQTPGLDRTVLFFLIISPYVIRTAEQAGVGVSDGQAERLLPRDSTPDPNAVRVLRTYLALQRLQDPKTAARLGEVQRQVVAARPRLNPRYGRFDVRGMTVVDAPPNWLAASATPTPEPTGPTQPPAP